MKNLQHYFSNEHQTNSQSMLRQILITASVSIACSILAVFIYRKIEGPREMVFKDPASSKFTSFDELLFSGEMQRNFASSAPNQFIMAAEKSTRSVVNIKALQGGSEDFFGTIGASSGSGVIISPDGYIITNNHVIEDATDIEITLNDRVEVREVTVVGTDPSTDIALLKINLDRPLPFAIFGNSDSIRVGEWVLAVGNPFNLESTVTAGIVSAKGRSINILEGSTPIESFIQTDAAVNPGNSGGALVNTAGELIGINTAIITKSGRYEGYSFAVPGNLAQKVVNDLKEYGVVQRGFLGIGIEDLTGDIAREMGLKNANGVVVTRINPNSAADDAGLQRNDIIVSINGKLIKSKSELLEQVAQYRPGNKLGLEYYRGTKRFKTNVVLKNKVNTTALIESRKDGILMKVGFELRDLSTDELRSLRVNGVKVISIMRNSAIEKTNMDPGFIITSINEREIENVQDAIQTLERNKGTIVLEGVYENYPGEYYYKFVL